jgi:hypothetical protein
VHWLSVFVAAEEQAVRYAIECCPFGTARWQASGVHWLSVLALLKSRLSGVPSYALRPFGAARWQASSGAHGLSVLALLKSRLPVCHPMLSILALLEGRPQVCMGYPFWRC